MRPEAPEELRQYRQFHPRLGGSPSEAMYGFFVIIAEDGRALRIISSGSSAGDKWEHVSVSHESRTPTWEEMDRIKKLFWRDNETVLQFHPKESAKINIHANCLHLWKIRGVNHDLPPKEFV